MCRYKRRQSRDVEKTLSLFEADVFFIEQTVFSGASGVGSLNINEQSRVLEYVNAVTD